MSTNLPALPPGVADTDVRAPNYLERRMLLDRMGMMAGETQAQRMAMRDSAQQQLAGYGVRFQQDDPNTKDLDESLNPGKDAALGERHKAAIANQRASHNERGMLYSSIANQRIGEALTQVDEEKRAIIHQYGVQTAEFLANQASRQFDITRDLLGLFGADAQWLAENPLPPPPAPAPAAKPPAAPKAQQMPTYQEFVDSHGGVSTSRLARLWDARFNMNARFGGK